MSEGHNFEIPPKSHDPQSIEAVLEKGEIKSAKELEGYWGIQLVEIKDGGDALFKPDMHSDFIFEAKEMKTRRSDLELMAYKIDKILEFDLVPAVVVRTIGEYEGALQRRIKNIYDGHNKEWGEKVIPEEITRAAIFDYLLDVRDRSWGNFIIDSETNKLWLIDHDFYMFYWEGEPPRTKIVEKAQENSLTGLSETETSSLQRFLDHSDSLTVGAKPEVVEIIKKAQDRARVLLKEGQIPSTNI